MEGKKLTFKVDGEIYDIDPAQEKDFLKDMPSAQKVYSFKADNEVYDIDSAQVSDFLNDMPHAKPTQQYADLDKALENQILKQSGKNDDVSASMYDPISVNDSVRDQIKRPIESNQKQQQVNLEVLSPDIKQKSDEIYGKIQNIDNYLSEGNQSVGFFAWGDDILYDRAKTIYARADRALKASTGEGGTGVGDAMSDMNFWTIGARDLSSMLSLKGIANDLEKGKKLTPGQVQLLDAWATMQEVEQTSGRGSMGYRVGKNITEMVPWLLQMYSTGGVGGAVKTGFVNALEKGAAKYLGKKIGGMAVKGAGEVVGAYAQASLMPNTYSDVLQRNIGEASRDKEGNVTGFRGGENALKATYKGMTNGMLEVLTERIGEGLAPMFNKGMQKLNLGQIGKRVFGDKTNAVFGNFGKMAKAVNWDGAPMEYFEEVINIPLNAMLVGDSKMSDLLDGEQQLETFLTVVAMGSAMAIPNIPHQVRYNKAKKEVKTAEEAAGVLIGKENSEYQSRFDAIKKAFDSNLPINELSKIIDENVNSISDNDVKASFLNYAKAKTSLSSYEGTLQQITPEQQAEQAERTQFGEQIKPLLHESGELVTITDEQGTIMHVVSGDMNDMDGMLRVVDEQGQPAGQNGFVHRNSVKDFRTSSVDAAYQVQRQIQEEQAAAAAQQQQNEQSPYVGGAPIEYNGKNWTVINDLGDSIELLSDDEQGETVIVPKSMFEEEQQSEAAGADQVVDPNGMVDENGQPVVQENLTTEQPAQKPIITETIGKNSYDFTENEDGSLTFAPNDKLTNEKALSQLEKEFKDNPDWEVVASKKQVEIPAPNRFSRPTKQTVIDEVVIRPKQNTTGSSTGTSTETRTEAENAPQTNNVVENTPVNEVVSPEVDSSLAENQAKQQEELIKAHDRVVSAMQGYNALTPAKRRKANIAKTIQEASALGYNVSQDKTGKLIITNANGSVIKRTAVRTPKADIEAHPAITDYEGTVAEFMASVIQNPETLNGVELGGLQPKELQKALEDIANKKKTVLSNKLLDELEAITERGTFIMKPDRAIGFPGAELSIDEFYSYLDELAQYARYAEDAALIPEDVARNIIDGQLTPEILDQFERLILPDHGKQQKETNGNADQSLPSTGETQSTEESTVQPKGEPTGQQQTNPIAEQISALENKRNSLEKEKQQKIDSANSRNGLFGDTKADPNDLFGGQGFDASQAQKIAQDYDSRIAKVNGEIEQLRKASETGVKEQAGQQEIGKEPVESKQPRPKGITKIFEEDNGKTLVYGTKRSQTRLSVKGYTTDEIQEELDFEKKRNARAEKEIPEQEEYLRTQMITDVSIAVQEGLRDNRSALEVTKITIPWLEKKLIESKQDQETNPLEELKSFVDKYNDPGEEIYSIDDLLNDIEGIDNLPADIEKLISDFREEQRVDFEELAGRNDMQTAEETLLNGLEKATEEVKTDEKVQENKQNNTIPDLTKLSREELLQLFADSTDPELTKAASLEIKRRKQSDQPAVSVESETKPEEKPVSETKPISLQEAVEKRAEHRKEQEKQEPVEKIEDFGEKISGAKKDLYQRMNSVTKDDILSSPLSKSFPRPDFKQLVSDGLLTEDGAIITKFLYDNIPSKPRKRYRLNQWASQVQEAIDVFSDMLSKEGMDQKFIDRLKSSDKFSGLSEKFEIFREVQKALGFPNEDVNTGTYEIVKFNGRDGYTIVKSPYIIADFPTIKEAASALKKILASNKEKSKDTKFSVYQDTKTKQYFIGKKSATGVVRLIDGLSREEAIDTLKNKNPQLQELWSNMKLNPNERRDTNRPRIGTDYRKGKDVTPEQFTNEFGFRGVQFGNWVNNDERQTSLNDAYDALMDLSTAIGVSPKALSLAGELGLAFGARGSGGKQAPLAHYEPGQVVINITKKKGAGSLAHEWWHALDNYFSRMRGENSGFLTEKPRQGVVLEGRSVVPDGRIRLEMHNAFENVVKSVRNSGLPSRSQQLDQTRSNKYWSQMLEMTARSFENFIINKLGATNEQNDYLANFKEMGQWAADSGLDTNNYPYPLKDEEGAINEAFQQFFETIEEKQEDGKNILFRNAEDTDPRFQIIGGRGASRLDEAEEATTRRDNLKVAREMEAEGFETIFNEAVKAQNKAEELNAKEDFDTDREDISAAIDKLYAKLGYADGFSAGRDFNRQLTEALRSGDIKQLPEGKGDLLIRMATGWERGVDGRWRYETGDTKIKDLDRLKEIRANALFEHDKVDMVNYEINPDGTYRIQLRGEGATSSIKGFVNYKSLTKSDLKEFLGQEIANDILNGKGKKHELSLDLDEGESFWISGKTYDFESENGTALKNIIQNEELFTAYPKLRDVILYFDEKQGGNAALILSRNQSYIVIGTQMPDRQIESAVNHEVQHYIQDVERFGQGGNTKMFSQEEYYSKAKEYGLVGKGLTDDEIKHEIYRRLAGETEARNVQSRMNMTDEERKSTLLSQTEDVSREDQIILRNGIGISELNFGRKNKDQIKQKIEAIQKRASGAAETIFVEDLNELPNAVKNHPLFNKNAFVAVTYDGKVYMNLNRINSEDEAVAIWVHENGLHNGIRNLMGGLNRTILFEKVYDSFAELAKTNPDYARVYNQVSKTYSRTDKATKGEEMAAMLAEKIINEEDLTPVEKTVWKKIVDYFKDLIGKLYKFDSSLLSESEIADIIRTAVQSNFEEPMVSDNQASFKQSEQLPETIEVNGKDRPTRNSNGQFIHPTKEGIENFWKWFGDSKVVDEEGRPLVVYHGTTKKFNRFKKTHDGQRVGIWFTDDIEEAKRYSDGWFDEAGGKGNVIESYLSIQNPYDMEKTQNENIELYDIEGDLYEQAVIKSLEKEGFDGVLGRYFEGNEYSNTVYVVLNPSQIKSATGNTGQFDTENADIRFKNEPEKPTSLGAYIMSDAGKAYREKAKDRRSLNETIVGMREFIQDRDMPIRKLEEEVERRTGKKLDDDSKPYRDLTRSYGRMEELFRQFTDTKMNPILDTLAKIIKSGMDGENILPYMIAKHAIERNEYKRYQELQAWMEANEEATSDEVDEFEKSIENKDYSGVMGFDTEKRFTNPDELAKAIVDEFESQVDKKLVDELWKNTKAATDQIVDTWKAGNSIDDEMADTFKNRFKNFVPLRGWREGAAKQLAYTKGEGFSRSLIKAEGRKSLAENPLAYMIKVQFQALGEQTDNEVKKSMFNLMRKNYGDKFKDLYQFKKVYYVRADETNPETGEKEEAWEMTFVKPTAEQFSKGEAKTKIYRQHQKLRSQRHANEHEVVVKLPGGDMVMIFPGKNLTVAQAMNHQNRMFRNLLNGKVMDADDFNRSYSWLAKPNNWLKQMYTSSNIVFPLTNFFRDAQEAAITQWIKGEHGEQVLKNYKASFPAVARRIYKKGKGNSKYDKLLNEFYEDGGATGYTHLRTPEELEREINKKLKRMLREGTVRGKTSDKLLKVMDAIENWNKLFEDATRFSVYLTMRENGATRGDAALAAKEASVNFNRKGKGSKAFDSVYAFFNVAIQSLQKNFKLAKDHPGKFASVAGAWMALGFMEAVVNNALSDGGDDDDDYQNISEYVRQNYLIIPTGTNKYVRIPLPQFWRGFHSAGNILYDVLFKDMKAGKATSKALMNFAGGMSPIDIGGFTDNDGEFSLSPLVPTVYKPIQEITENRNFMGYRIAKEPFTEKQKNELARSGLGKDNVNPAIKFFTDMLFRFGGGDNETKKYMDQNGVMRDVPGMLDINPSQIEHLLKGYTGGTGAVVVDAMTTAWQGVEWLKGGEPIDFKNAPFVNAFIKKTPEAKWRVINEYYTLKEELSGFSGLERAYKNQTYKSGSSESPEAEKYKRTAGNNYYKEYESTVKAYDALMDIMSEDVNYQTGEGTDEIVDMMKTAIGKLKEVKQRHNRK